MKKTFLELKNYYAAKRGYGSFDSLDANEQVVALAAINQVIDTVWYYKQWAFTKAFTQFTTLAPLTTGTVSGSVGEKTITFSGVTLQESYYGVPLQGQLLYIGGDVYKIEKYKSSSSLVLSTGLKGALSASGYQILFVNYPTVYGIGAIRGVKSDLNFIEFGNEEQVDSDNRVGTVEMIYGAGTLGFDFKEFTGSLSDDASTITSVSGVTAADEHIGMSVMVENVGEVFKIVDIDSGDFILDRKFQGTAISGGTFILLPKETPLIGVYPYPQTAQLIGVSYTKEHPELVEDTDRSWLPNDTPILAGLDYMAVKFEEVGEGNINEKILNDRKFIASMRVLNSRGSSNKVKFKLPDRNRFNRTEKKRWR